ncbi:MAG: glycosyl transferase family 2 [Geobacteraceae bacterium GWC2_55_20]|nr:MAG: glycosyl transferase family 2 [Geobacteraceae bacterium GWC2_55_20]OGU22836.1 MAG: glycosyl transferase family 2 [Geobacteraceae bacterium GWF2_54_21]HBA72007.1 glycosyl transferase family 2 [Geobacter sp.]HCE67710.1 glycosyl transferase family 2 [Geobacter sp.]
MTTISIVVPVKHGGHVAAFDSIRQSGYDKNIYEVLLAEGSAPSQQRNLAARAATGDILYFIDDDSRLHRDSLSICRDVMDDQGVAVAGGPSITPPEDSWLQRLFGFALSSVLGSGGVRNRYRAFGTPRETTDKELILCNLAIRRSVFLALDGFDERLYPNEENELLDRVRSAGFRLMHVPDMKVLRSQRSTLKAFVRQMFAYGRGRAQQSLITGSFPVISYVPLLFVLYLIVCLCFPFYKMLLLPLLMYAALVSVFTLIGVRQTGSVSAITLLLLYPLMHCVNGIGLMYGLTGGKPGPVRGDGIVVTRIKEFGQEFPEPD